MRSPSPRGGPQPPRSTALYEAILRLQDLEECLRFFDDLCAVTELRTLEQRYDVAGCLMQGKVYSEIRRETGASSATVSRVNRMLNYGTGQVAQSVRYDLEHAPGGQPGPTQPDTQEGDSL
ncbi:MAG: YerC/YecD family TrpR-related protein [Gemmiger sp.]